MPTETTLIGPHKDFESIKRIDENGVEFWTARDLFPLLGYPRWEKFDDVITRAARAALQSGQAVKDHFHRTVKMVEMWRVHHFAGVNKMALTILLDGATLESLTRPALEPQGSTAGLVL